MRVPISYGQRVYVSSAIRSRRGPCNIAHLTSREARRETDDRIEFDSTAQSTVPPNKIAHQSSYSSVLSLIRSPLGRSIDLARSFVSADRPSAGFDAF
jgi:hypothetical protein